MASTRPEPAASPRPRRRRHGATAALWLTLSLPAQNLVPNGEFEQGGLGWTRQFLPMTSGTTGFTRTRVAGNGPSMAMFSSMRTPTGPLMTVYGSWYLSAPFALPAQQHTVSVRAMWENHDALPLPTGNAAQLLIRDAANTVVCSFALVSPNPTASTSRATGERTFVAAGGLYRAELRLDNGLPTAGVAGHTIWVDDVVIGSPVSSVFGQGCPGSGQVVPVIDSVNWPQIGSGAFAVEVHDAFAPTVGLFALDLANSAPLPLGGGCWQLVGTGALWVAPIAGSGPGQGFASQPLPIPADPGLAGLRLFCQWGIGDPGAPNAWPLAVTAGTAFTIQ